MIFFMFKMILIFVLYVLIIFYAIYCYDCYVDSRYVREEKKPTLIERLEGIENSLAYMASAQNIELPPRDNSDYRAKSDTSVDASQVATQTQ